jgi:hypothetical protein
MFRKLILALIALVVVGCAGMGKGAATGEVPRMSKEELKGKLGSPDVIVLDVRRGEEWRNADKKIVGAVRESADSIDDLVSKYPKDKTLVLYCA